MLWQTAFRRPNPSPSSSSAHHPLPLFLDVHRTANVAVLDCTLEGSFPPTLNKNTGFLEPVAWRVVI